MTRNLTDSETTTRRRLLETTGSTGLALFGLTQGVSAREGGSPPEDSENRGRRGEIHGQLTGQVAASEQYRHVRSVLREDGYRPELGKASVEEVRSSDVPADLSHLAGEYLVVPCVEQAGHDHGDHPEDMTVEVVAFAPESGGIEVTAIARQSSVPIASIYSDGEIVETEPGHVASPGGGH